MAEALSGAARANLEKILAKERLRTAWWLAWLRLTLSVIGAVIVATAVANAAMVAPSRWAAGIFLVMSAGVLVALKVAPAWAQWAGYLVPFIDTPLLGLAQYAQRQRLPEDWFGLPSGISLMLALLVVSSLALSKRIVWATWVGATVSMVAAMRHAERLPLVPIAMTTSATFLMAVVLSLVVERVRRLVHESRASDLMGKYILGQRLGAGGMAEVFLATYSPEGGFERVVAVKRILPAYAADPESVALFRREAELGAILAHPNVVQVLDFGSYQDSYFLAMEYIDGLTLGRLLAWSREARQPLPLSAVVYVGHALAEACQYIHTRTDARGVPLELRHRDLNPPNVLVSRIGEVKLGDFGIARAASQAALTQAGVMRGKLGYAAPEQVLGVNVDHRADLFSLGLTLHELLTGARVFTGPTETELLKAVLEGPIAPPSALRPEVPPALDALVLGLLERDLERRIPSGVALAGALSRLPPELFDPVVGRALLAEFVTRAQLASGANALEATPLSNERTVTSAMKR